MQRQPESIQQIIDVSGFVYEKAGQVFHIVTNENVVSGFEEEQFYVYFQDGRQYVGKVIGTDPLADIAVLQIARLHGFS